MTPINTEGGINKANTLQLEAALTTFPEAKIQTAEQFKDNQGHI